MTTLKDRPLIMTRLRKYLNRKSRLDDFAHRVMNRPVTDSRSNRVRSRAALRAIRLQSRQPAFKAWSGDNFQMVILIKLTSALDEAIEGIGKLVTPRLVVTQPVGREER